MNRRVDPASPVTTSLGWPERNQRWLSQRVAYWRERISRPSDDGADLGLAELPLEAPSDFEPAAFRIAALFGLSAFEREVLILAAGVEIDVALRDAVAQAQGMAAQAVRLSFSLALSLLPDPHWDALSPLAPLRHWSLVEVDTRAGFAQALLRIDERLLHYLTGVAAFDERLIGIAQLDDATGSRPVDALASSIAHAMAGVHAPLVMLVNGSEASRKRAGRALARETFRHLGLRTLWVDSSALGGDARDASDTARRLDREGALASAGIALAVDADTAHAVGAQRVIEALRGPVIVLGTLSPPQLADVPSRQVLRFNVPLQEALRLEMLAPAIRRAAGHALQQFRVEPALLEQALASVTGLDDESAIQSALWNALRESARGGLETLGQRIDSRVTFDDLVVPPVAAAQLREIASQLRHRQKVYEEWGFGERYGRGLGIAALFAGESGTGKTLAAEVIANEAGLDLYRIDLASVVSKYIGETEKNLSKVFDAAERSGAVLLFDEADALFGKRSEVKDSHDRYANVEVAYLLQRIESYRGLAILTSNQRGALDRSFLRRIRFVVHFPFPDEAAREQIWRRQFPSRAPLGELEFTALARLQLAGGHIRGVVLNAAFRAADRSEPVGHAALMAAAQAEFAKLERPLGGAALAVAAVHGGGR